MRALSLLPWIALAALLAGCSSDITLPNEQNSYYQQGMTLQQEGKQVAAAKAYENCLRFSPKSYKAHLQLAIICEDSLKDLPAAIDHYQAFLRDNPDLQQAETVKRFLQRAEEAYYRQLQDKYGGAGRSAMDTPAGYTPSIPAPPPPPPAATPATPSNRPPTRAPIASGDAVLPAVSAATVPATPRTPAAPAIPATYTVQAGDTLSTISHRVYGSSDHWQAIYKLNRDQLPSADKLQVGMVLKLPTK